MTTIVNNPAPQTNDSGGGMGMIIGLVVVVVLVILFFLYGLPLIQQMQFGGPQINVPSEIDVNIKQTQ